MNKVKNVALILTVLMVFFLAGCGGPSNGDTKGSSDALKIINWHMDPLTEVYDGESVYFEVEVRNDGRNAVENVYPRLVGLSDSFVIQDEPGMISTIDPSPEGYEVSELLSWVFIPMAMQTTIQYPFEVAIDYDYITHSEAIIRVASRDWIRSLTPEEQEKELQNLGQISASAPDGPIHTEFRLSSNTPYAERGEATVYLEIKNIGSGRSVDDEVFVTVTSGNLVCDNAGTVNLINGRDGHLKCTAYIGDVEQWKSIEASVELSYKYTIRKTDLSVTVVGKSEEF